MSLSFAKQQTFGLVGESGSGKTTLARMVAGLTPPTGGTIFLEDEALRPTVDKRDRDVLRRLQMVFQSPESSLNPRHTVRPGTRPPPHAAGRARPAGGRASARSSCWRPCGSRLPTSTATRAS